MLEKQKHHRGTLLNEVCKTTGAQCDPSTVKVVTQKESKTRKVPIITDFFCLFLSRYEPSKKGLSRCLDFIYVTYCALR